MVVWYKFVARALLPRKQGFRCLLLVWKISHVPTYDKPALGTTLPCSLNIQLDNTHTRPWKETYRANQFGSGSNTAIIWDAIWVSWTSVKKMEMSRRCCIQKKTAAIIVFTIRKQIIIQQTMQKSRAYYPNGCNNSRRKHIGRRSDQQRVNDKNIRSESSVATTWKNIGLDCFGLNVAIYCDQPIREHPCSNTRLDTQHPVQQMTAIIAFLPFTGIFIELLIQYYLLVSLRSYWYKKHAKYPNGRTYQFKIKI